MRLFPGVTPWMALRLPVRLIQLPPAFVVSQTPLVSVTKACCQSLGSSAISVTLPPGKAIPVAVGVPSAVVAVIRANTLPLLSPTYSASGLSTPARRPPYAKAVTVPIVVPEVGTLTAVQVGVAAVPASLLSYTGLAPPPPTTIRVDWPAVICAAVGAIALISIGVTNEAVKLARPAAGRIATGAPPVRLFPPSTYPL